MRRDQLEIGLEREYAIYASIDDTVACLLACERLLAIFHAHIAGDAGRQRRWRAMAADGWRSGTNATFGIHVEGIDGVVGGIGVRFLDDLDDGCAEIGYWVASEARGRGVATAATRAVAKWAFGAVPELARIQLRADVENVASNRVAEKAGFTREGVLRAHRYNVRLGRRSDFVMWSLLREEL